MSKIRELRQKMERGELSCRELTEAYLAAAKKENERLGAYVTITEECALAAAGRVDDKLARSEKLMPLEGIPAGVKDNISTKGIQTSCGSKMLANYSPVFDATVWKAMQEQNAVMVGKCDMDEFAMGSTCETSYFGGAKNPHDLSYVPGGSSGGSAAAVGGSVAVYALGSDTGGSIREPASFCGVVGLKPTYGSVSRYGLVAFASSLDQIGPIAPTAEDAAIVFDNISERDPRDMTSRGYGKKTADTLDNSLEGIKIGIAKEFYDGIDGDIAKNIERAMEVYKGLGAEFVDVELPLLKYALPVYYILACAEASSNLGRFDGIRYGYKAKDTDELDEMIKRTRSEGFGREVQRRILLGTYVLSSGYFDAYYKKAQLLRRAIIRDFEKNFTNCDLMLTPTVPVAVPKLGADLDPIEVYHLDICTVTVNIAGLPAISEPCGFDRNGLPTGMQLIGPAFSEDRILNSAHMFEKETGGEFIKLPEMGCRL